MGKGDIVDSKMFQSGEIRILRKSVKPMRYNLQMIYNGLFICNIKLINTYDSKSEPIICKALIDTGSDSTIICNSVFDKLNIRNEDISSYSVRNINKEINDISICPVTIHLPNNNWQNKFMNVGVLDLSDREYSAIIGVDILKDYKLYCDWITGTGWLEY